MQPAVTHFWLDLAKMERAIHFVIVRRVLDEEASRMALQPEQRRAFCDLMEVLLCHTMIVIPDGTVYKRQWRSLSSGAKKVQSLESWISSVQLAIVRSELAARAERHINICLSFNVLADDGFLVLRCSDSDVCCFIGPYVISIDIFSLLLKDKTIYKGNADSTGMSLR